MENNDTELFGKECSILEKLAIQGLQYTQLQIIRTTTQFNNVDPGINQKHFEKHGVYQKNVYGNNIYTLAIRQIKDVDLCLPVLQELQSHPVRDEIINNLYQEALTIKKQFQQYETLHS